MCGSTRVDSSAVDDNLGSAFDNLIEPDRINAGQYFFIRAALKSYGAVDCCRESAVIVELSKSRISASDTGSEPVSDIAVKCKVEAFCTNVRLL